MAVGLQNEKNIFTPYTFFTNTKLTCSEFKGKFEQGSFILGKTDLTQKIY